MPSNILLCGVILFLSTQFTFAQGTFQSTDLQPQINSPEAANLGKYVTLPVNLNTGSPEISIPVYTLEYGGMSLPISLSYDASGVKVEELASVVGLKWNLHVGGALMRIVRGTYDEGNYYAPYQGLVSTRGYYSSYGLTELKNNIDVFENQAGELGIYLNNLANGYQDGQPDIYSYNVGAHSGKFYFNENRELISYDQKDVVIEETYTSGSTRSRFMGWDITVEDGTKFTFGKTESAIEKVYSSNINSSSNQWQDNSWVLTRVYNPKTNREITLEYKENKYATGIISNQSKHTCMVYADGSGGCILKNHEELYCSSGIVDQSNVLSQQNYSVPILSKITAGDTEIIFTSSGRTDLHGYLGSTPLKLDQIEIRYRGSCIRKFKFSYNYFSTSREPVNFLLFGTDLSETSKKRLKLLSFTESSCDEVDKKTHSFVYNETHSLPPRISFARDSWGYFNGEDDNRSLYPNLFPYYDACINDFFADRKVRLDYAKSGTLKEIIYPTKGSTEFVYESHKSDYPVVKNKGWVILADLSTGNSSPVDTDPPIVVKEAIFTADNRHLRMEGTIYGWTPWNKCTPTGTMLGPIYEVIDMQSGARVDVFDAYSTVDGNDSNDGMRSIKNVLDLTSGKTYKIKVYGYGHMSYAGLCFWADLDLKRLEELPPQPDDYLVGGLRIASIKFKNDDGSVLLSNSYDYTQSSLLYNPKFLYRQSYDADQPIFGLSAYYFIDDFEPNLEYFQSHKSGEFYLLTTDDPYTLDFSGSHISYGRVTEKTGEGQTVYTFYPPQTYQQVNGYTNYNNIPVRPVTQSPYAGKLVLKEIFDELGNLKQKDKYSYSIQLSNIETPAFAVAKPGTYQGVGFVHYNLRPSSLYLTSRVSTQYEANKEVSKETKYYYEGSGHSQVTRMETEKSNGETKKEIYTYPQDVSNPTSSESELIAQNRINEVIKTESLVNGTPLSVSKINYQTSNGLVLPDFVEIAYGGEDPVVEITFSRYDDLGNPLEYKGKDGIPGSYIWGYNHTLPVAKIVNATFSEVEAISGFGAKFHAGAEGLSQSQENSLRSTLPNAQIITYSYYPLIGMASQTDSNGRTIYYYYDGLGRLKSIKDHNQKVLKAYQYHYK